MRAKKARLDADRTAKPLTRLVGHARFGDCVGPGTTPADALEDVETGDRTPLVEGPKLVAVQLETCHANTDGTAWYGYFTAKIASVKPYRAEIRRKAKRDGAPLGVDFDDAYEESDGLDLRKDGKAELVQNALSRHAGLFRYYVAGAS